jgi:hypothetical protein
MQFPHAFAMDFLDLHLGRAKMSELPTSHTLLPCASTLFHSVPHLQGITWRLRPLYTPTMQERTITARPTDWSAGQDGTVEMQPGRDDVLSHSGRNKRRYCDDSTGSPFSSLSSNNRERHICHVSVTLSRRQIGASTTEINLVHDSSRTT